MSRQSWGRGWGAVIIYPDGSERELSGEEKEE